MTYDANGNMTADGTGNTYTYDAWNRLVAVKNGEHHAGRLQLRRPGPAGPADARRDDDRPVLLVGRAGARRTTSAASCKRVRLEPGLRQRPGAARPVQSAAGTLDQRLYVLQDANWNVTALVDTTGNVVERYVYNPYGDVTVLTPAWTAEGQPYAMPYLWQGLRYDAAVGLYHADIRDISPTLKRPLQADPLGLAPGNNDYEWEGDDRPIRLIPVDLLFSDPPHSEVPVSTAAIQPRRTR